MSIKEKKTAVTLSHLPLHQYKGNALVLGLFQGTKSVPKAFQPLDKSADGALSQLLKLGDFTGKANETSILYLAKQAGFKRIILLGLGPQKEITPNTFREAAGTAVRLSQDHNLLRLGLALHLLTDKFEPAPIAQAIAEGALAGRYDYQEHLTLDEDRQKKSMPMRITLLDPSNSARRQSSLKQGCRIGVILAQGQNLSRAIANQPGNQINPPVLGRLAQSLARQHGLTCKLFDEKKLKQLGCNAILAVGSGSANKPRLISLEYNRPRSGSPKPDVVLVGKAITFDSGGISLKPSANMQDMKFDKCGGCNVIAAMVSLTRLKLPLHVVGLIASAENLPSQTAYRPGDIIKTYNGKTVEVQNTDAEGRLVLADALAYAARMKPTAIIDMATLTGAIVVALGSHFAGLFSNNTALLNRIKKASELSGESLWPMPSGPPYLQQMRSKIADLKNIDSRRGSACTAAAFLGEFVGDIPWAHIDIAAVADTSEQTPYRSVGATGFALRLVMEYLRELAKKK